MPFSKKVLLRAAAAVFAVALAVLAFTLGPRFTQSGRSGGKNMPTPGVDFNGTEYVIGADGPEAQLDALPEGYALIGRVGEGSGKNRLVGYGFSDGDPLYRNPAYPNRMYVRGSAHDYGGSAYQLLVNVNKIGALIASHIPE